MRSSIATAGRMPMRTRANRCTSARTRFVVMRPVPRATAAYSIRSASACLPSLALATANQALLSTKTRLGARSPAAVRRPMFRHVSLFQIVIEVLAQIGRETVEHAAQLEDGIVGRRPGERPDGEANGARFRPASFLNPALEAGEVGVVEVHLDGPSHDRVVCAFMNHVSISS